MIYSFFVVDEKGAARPLPIRYADTSEATTELMNVSYDAATQTLYNFEKGRGLGDCGATNTWVWDGKGFAPLFYPGYSDDAKALQKASLKARLDYLEGELKTRPYLTGDRYTVADGYLFVVLGWTGYVGLDLGDWPTLKAYHARIAGRPAVQAALKAEGLAG